MSEVIARPRNIAEKAAQVTTPAIEHEFIKGRDLAIKCLEEAQAANEVQSEETNCLRWIRKGGPQDNFVLGWIVDTVGGPSVLQNQALRGFCAVLSDYLSNPAGTMYPHAYDIPYAEFQGGEVGADGTQPTPPEIEGVADVGSAEDSALSAPDRFDSLPASKVAGLHDTKWAADALAAANVKIDCAHEVLQEYTYNNGTGVMWGLLALVGTLQAAIVTYSNAENVDDPRDGALQDLHGDIGSVCDVIDAANEKLNCAILHAVNSLLYMATDIIEKASEAEISKRKSEAPNA